MEFIFKKDTSTENAVSGETSYLRTSTLNHSDPDTSVKVDIMVKGNTQDVAEFLITKLNVSKVNDKCDASFQLISRQTDLNEHLSEDDITKEGITEADE